MQEVYESLIRGLKQSTGKHLDKLKSYPQLLGMCMSNKAIDIRKREATALQARAEKVLGTETEQVEGQITASCEKVESANLKFAEETLKPFEQGGKYAQETIDAYRCEHSAWTASIPRCHSLRIHQCCPDCRVSMTGAYSDAGFANAIIAGGIRCMLNFMSARPCRRRQSIDSVSAHMVSTLASQQEQLQATKAALEADLTAALEHTLELLPAHQQDMTLIEAVKQVNWLENCY